MKFQLFLKGQGPNQLMLEFDDLDDFLKTQYELHLFVKTKDEKGYSQIQNLGVVEKSDLVRLAKAS